MRALRRFEFIIVPLFLGMTGGGSSAEPGAQGAEQKGGSDVRIKLTSTADEAEGIGFEARELLVTADKPGFVHLWHYYGDEGLMAPLLPDPDGGGYHRRVTYEARDLEGGVLGYRIVPEAGEPERSEEVKLWGHRHVSYEEFTKGLREIGDPSGICLRGVPLDLAPLQSEALLMAVTDGPEVSQVGPWYLRIWHPTYFSGTKLPAELESVAVQVGYMVTTPGDAANKTDPPSGQQVGRVSQRNGKLIAHLKYQYRSLSGFDGEIIPELPFDFEVRAFSGAVYPVVGVLTREPQVMPFLLDQLRKDLKGSEFEGLLDRRRGEDGGTGSSAVAPDQ